MKLSLSKLGHLRPRLLIRSVPSVALTKLSGKASARGDTKFSAFYKAKDASRNVKSPSCEVKGNIVGEASPVLSKTKALASGKVCLSLSRANTPASGEASLLYRAKYQPR